MCFVGLDQPDFQGFPTNFWLHFNKVAIIVQMQSPDGVDSIEGELRDWEETEALLRDIDPSISIERWLGVYFGRSATCPMAKCNAEPPLHCEPPVAPSYSFEECLAGMQGYLAKYDGHNIKGLIYDDEVGDPFKIGKIELELLELMANSKLRCLQFRQWSPWLISIKSRGQQGFLPRVGTGHVAWMGMRLGHSL